MQTGLLWYDDDPRKPLERKIEQAAARYREKFGQSPNTCYVNAATNGIDGKKIGVRVICLRSLRPNYLWIGIDKAAKSADRERLPHEPGWIV